MGWRLFNHLQELVGAGLVHLLRQPYHHDLISALARLEAELAYDGLALVGIDEELLVLKSKRRHPLCHAEVGAVDDLLPPVAHELVAVAVLAAALLVYGEGEVEVGVLKLLRHLASSQQHLGVGNG